MYKWPEKPKILKPKITDKTDFNAEFIVLLWNIE